MPLDATVLNAQAAAATAMFDTVALATGPEEADEDTGIAAEALTWGSPASGVSTASATFTNIQGEWTHLLFFNGATFVGSVARDITFDVADDLVLSLRVEVEEDD